MVERHARAKRLPDAEPGAGLRAAMLEKTAEALRTVLPSRVVEPPLERALAFLLEHSDRLLARAADDRILAEAVPLSLDDVQAGEGALAIAPDARSLHAPADDLAVELAGLAIALVQRDAAAIAERLVSHYAGEAEDFGLYGVLDYHEAVAALRRALGWVTGPGDEPPDARAARAHRLLAAAAKARGLDRVAWRYARGVWRTGRFATVLASLLLGCAEAPDPTGTFRLEVRDAATDAPVPARIEIRGPDGAFHVPNDALELTLQCVTAPPPDWAAGWVRTRTLANPHTGTTQFYAAEPFTMPLPVGRYRVRAYRGNEYPVDTFEMEVEAGEETGFVVRQTPFTKPWTTGWVAADDHLHITRRTDDDDARIAAWMRAEGLHVANLLQMGTVDQFGVTPQRAFGPEGSVRSEGVDPQAPHWLLPGQEHPRTHFLGHTITLGAREPVDRRDTYILYETTFRAGRELGGVSGFAHWGLGPAQDGLAVNAPRGLVGFVEVLQFEMPHYAIWYELLDLGLRIAPTAGTDFPCGPWSVPGRERFYARVDPPLTPESFVEAIRAGRTYVTNGPTLGSFSVAGAEIGADVALDAPAEVRVRGELRFDPERDAIAAVDVILGGEIVPLRTEREGFSLRFDQHVPVDRTTWLALRVSGDKLGEAPFEPLDYPDLAWKIGSRIGDGAHGVADLRQDLARSRERRLSALHTAPVWVTVAGTPPLPAQAEGAARRAAYRERLEGLDARLDDARLPDQTIWDWVPYSDGVPESHLRRHRDALRAAIAEARAALEP